MDEDYDQGTGTPFTDDVLDSIVADSRPEELSKAPDEKTRNELLLLELKEVLELTPGKQEQLRTTRQIDDLIAKRDKYEKERDDCASELSDYRERHGRLDERYDTLQMNDIMFVSLTAGGGLCVSAASRAPVGAMQEFLYFGGAAFFLSGVAVAVATKLRLRKKYQKS